MKKDSCCRINTVEPLSKRLFDGSVIGIILVLLYFIGKELNIIPSFNFSGKLSYFTIFLIGIIASTSTCMATSGALYLSTVKKNTNNFFNALVFSTGRIFSYGLFGFIIGLVGQTLVDNLHIGSWLLLIASVFMILLGLNMADITSISLNIFNLNINERLKTRTNFLLGFLTYFLPCGFTQAIQIYALGMASPWQSALIMIIFTVGTAPALLLLGTFSNFTETNIYKYFIKIMGMLIFIIGVSYLFNYLIMSGVVKSSLFSKSQKENTLTIKNGIQTIKMNVNTNGYYPNYFIVKKNIPVKWEINGVNVFGCQAYFTVPSLGIRKNIESGINLIEFTPKEKGNINFSCGMGMYRGQIKVID